MVTRTPASPHADEVEEQFGVEAELYAEVRAAAADAAGFDKEAAAWKKVRVELDSDQESDPPPS